MAWVIGGVVLLSAMRARAGDCICVDWPAERRLAEASAVYLARYVDHSVQGPKDALRFKVIHSLKGEARGDHTVERPYDLECDRSFQKGELALVFEVKGRLPICGGNVDLDKLLPTFDTYLQGGSEAPSMEALSKALAGRWKASKVSAYLPAYANKTLSAGGTQVRFAEKFTDDLSVVSGTELGPLGFVSLRRPDGIATYVLLAKERGKWKVLASLDRDTKLK